MFKLTGIKTSEKKTIKIVASSLNSVPYTHSVFPPPEFHSSCCTFKAVWEPNITYSREKTIETTHCCLCAFYGCLFSFTVFAFEVFFYMRSEQ